MTRQKDDWQNNTLLLKLLLKGKAIDFGHRHVENQATSPAGLESL